MTIARYDFDTAVERRAHYQAKWSYFGEDVLPLWVADMDYAAPEPITDALRSAADIGTYGYQMDYPPVKEAIVQRMKARYNWDIEPDQILSVPGVVTGLGVVTRALGQPGGGILVQTPIYPPFLSLPPNNNMFAQRVDMMRVADGDNVFHYEIDFDAFEAAITPQTSLFFLCNPHNPAGRAFTRDELQRLAEICLKHDVFIVADEIHSDLLFDDTQHIPVASLSDEISANTITLIAPSKTFNIPGLHASFMIVHDDEMREKMNAAIWGTAAFVNNLGFIAADAAYRHCDDWLTAALDYMQSNRDLVVQSIQDHMPSIKTTVPEATYLCWLDCRGLQLPDDMTPVRFFLEEARVALNDGATFGKAGEGFVRLNVGTTRAILNEALERMAEAVASL